MPTYTYTCTACNDVIEKRQSFSDAPLTTCEQCGGTLRKVIHPVGIVFKGSGWYVTDSRSSSSSSTNGVSSSSKSTDSSTSTDTPDTSSSATTSTAPSTKSESKSDSKSESKSASKKE